MSGMWSTPRYVRSLVHTKKCPVCGSHQDMSGMWSTPRYVRYLFHTNYVRYVVHTKECSACGVRYVVHTKICPVCGPHQTCHVASYGWMMVSWIIHQNLHIRVFTIFRIRASWSYVVCHLSSIRLGLLGGLDTWTLFQSLYFSNLSIRESEPQTAINVKCPPRRTFRLKLEAVAALRCRCRVFVWKVGLDRLRVAVTMMMMVSII